MLTDDDFAALSIEELLDRLAAISPDMFSRALGEVPGAKQLFKDAQDANFFKFIPRPDNPAEMDQQHSFCYGREDQVSFLIGGNAAGTTEAASFRTALFLLNWQRPPRRDTPFWVISPTIEISQQVCWLEKLLGHGHIPECEIDWPRCEWDSMKLNLPRSIALKPWPKAHGGDPDKNWRIVFKSTEQGRELMQARSIGGFWFSEQFPLEIFLEVLRGCRECMFPGGQFAEFTPIDPELSLWVEEMLERLPKGWSVYRANTRSNRVNLAEGWFEQFFGTVPDEMVATRMTGQLAGFEGVIFPSFMLASHVIPESMIAMPHGVSHAMGTDWGSSSEHPHATILGYRDGIGDWVIYDEYFSPQPGATTEEHARGVMQMLYENGWPIVPDPKCAIKRKIQIESINERDPRSKSEWGTNWADPSRPDKISEFSNYGIPTLPSSNSVLPGIEYMQSLMKIPRGSKRPRIVISSRCKNLIKQLRKYRWVRGRKPTSSILNPTVPTAAPLKRDDDAVDAARYLVYSADRLLGSAPDSLSKWPDQNRSHPAVQVRRRAQEQLQKLEDHG